MESLLKQMLLEQQRTNQLLLMLIEALGESESDSDAEPVRYLDGSSIHGYQPKGSGLAATPPKER